MNNKITECDKQLISSIIITAISDIKIDITKLKDKNKILNAERNKLNSKRFLNSDWGRILCEEVGMSPDTIKRELMKQGAWE